MCCGTCGDISFADLLRDPLIQLVMQSDGVTEQEMVQLQQRVCRAQTAHIAPVRPARPADF